MLYRCRRRAYRRRRRCRRVCLLCLVFFGDRFDRWTGGCRRWLGLGIMIGISLFRGGVDRMNDGRQCAKGGGGDRFTV